MKSQHPDPGPAPPLAPGDQAETLPDGTLRVRPRPTRAQPPFVGEKWHLGPGYLEVRRGVRGLGCARRYVDCLLWLEARRGRAGVRWALVLQAEAERRVLAVADEARLRALGGLIAGATGWRLRVNSVAQAARSRAGLFPVPVFLILGGLAAAGIGFAKPYGEAALVSRLSPATAVDLLALDPGAPVLGVGRVEPATAIESHGLVAYNTYRLRVRRRSRTEWERLDQPYPSFWVDSDHGRLRVAAGAGVVLNPAREVRIDNQKYLGFQTGDRVTVFGKADVDNGRRTVIAQMINGGTPGEYVRGLERQAFLLSSVGLVASLIGALFLRALLRACC